MPFIEVTFSENDYLNVIGRITVNLTRLEDEMTKAIGILIGEDGGANIRITAGEPFLNLLRLLDVLFRYRITDESILKQFKKITADLEKVNNDRNINVHGVLNFFETSNSTIVTKYKYSKRSLGKFKIDTTPPTLDTLKEIAQSIEDVRTRLFKLMLENILAIKEHHSRVIKEYHSMVIKIESSLNLASKKHLTKHRYNKAANK